ncbi:MAG: hypothetical protein M1827_003337 [Pycnora praestabilis]|nr:MAG: hypothetical protein M1827_003337 [Pycnora praestabilis]
MSNPGNIVGGHKANINNPNTSEEAKQHSKEVLDQEFNGGDVPSAGDKDKNPNNVAGGLKAAINNPSLGQDSKDMAQEKLDAM